MSYKNILIVYKQSFPRALEIAREVRDWLCARSIGCELRESPLILSQIEQKPDFALVVGGDGTLIGLARNIIPENIPIFGLNLGTLGFLSSAELHDWQSSLEEALNGQMPIRSCLTLRWELFRAKRKPVSGFAINEVVIGRGALARLVNLDVIINKHYMGLLRCDGVIVCTPVGSSAYAISAGGSLTHPELAVSCLVPICPFPNSVSPLVMPENTEYEFRIMAPGQECELTIDGQEGLSLSVEDAVRVAASSMPLRIFGDERNFLSKLDKRGFSLKS